MSRNQRWFRVYDRVIDSPQVMRLSLPERGLLVSLWAVASVHDGLIPYDMETLRLRLHIREEDAAFQAMLANIIKQDLLIELIDEEFEIPRWHDHQHDKPSDAPSQAAERKRRQREREKEREETEKRDILPAFVDTSRPCHGLVTPMSRDVTRRHALEAEAEAESESDTESEAERHTREGQQPFAGQQPAANDGAPRFAAAKDFSAVLLAEGFTEGEIALAYAEVSSRPNPPRSVTSWAKYLRPLLLEMRQQRVSGLESVSGSPVSVSDINRRVVERIKQKEGKNASPG